MDNAQESVEGSPARDETKGEKKKQQRKSSRRHKKKTKCAHSATRKDASTNSLDDPTGETSGEETSDMEVGLLRRRVEQLESVVTSLANLVIDLSVAEKFEEKDGQPERLEDEEVSSLINTDRMTTRTLNSSRGSGFFSSQSRKQKCQVVASSEQNSLSDSSNNSNDSLNINNGESMNIEPAAVDKEKEQVRFAEDSFSFLVTTQPWSIPFLLALLVVAIKNTIFVMVLLDLYNNIENKFDIPVLVPVSVLVAQFIALGISVVTQNDIISSLMLLHRGHNEDVKNAFPQGGSFWQWVLSVILSFIDGAMGLCVTFILIITSSTVLDVLLNFVAVAFVLALDEVAFHLSKLGLLGNISLMAAKAILEKTFTRSKRRINATILQIVLMVLVVAPLYLGWSVTFIKQKKGQYATQTLYLQFSDGINQDLAAHSGFYTMERSSIKDRFLYTEVRGGNGHIGYCLKQSRWTFFVEGDDACSNILAQSTMTDSSQVLESASHDWFVRGSPDIGLVESVLIPMPVFYLSAGCKNDQECENGQGTCEDNRCICQPGFHGVRCTYSSSSVCPLLQLDEQFGTTFSSSRSIEETFDLYKRGEATCYDRPIFINNKTQDVLFFMGIRWALSNTGMVFGTSNTFYNNSSIVLEKLVSPSFHASEIVYVDFVSDLVPFQTDGGIVVSPEGLSWFAVIPTSGAGSKTAEQVATQRLGTFLKTPEPVKFLCAKCNNSTSPCFYQGVCDLHGECLCQNRALGSLCQVAPTGDGRCDTFFNTNQFGFDGGDCCMQTCKNSLENTCGMLDHDVVSPVYLGFKSCIDQNYVVSKKHCEDDRGSCIVPITQIASTTLARPTPIISANGRYMAVVEHVGFQVFELIGSSWVQLGETVTFSTYCTMQGSLFDPTGQGTAGAVAFSTEAGNTVKVGNVLGMEMNLLVTIIPGGWNLECDWHCEDGFLYKYSRATDDWEKLARVENVPWGIDGPYIKSSLMYTGALTVGGYGSFAFILFNGFQLDDNFRRRKNIYRWAFCDPDCDSDKKLQLSYEIEIDGIDSFADVSGDGMCFLKFNGTLKTLEIQTYPFKSSTLPLELQIEGNVQGMKLSHLGDRLTVVTTLAISNATKIHYYKLLYTRHSQTSKYLEMEVMSVIKVSEYGSLAFPDLDGVVFSPSGTSLALYIIPDKQSFKNESKGTIVYEVVSVDLHGNWKNRGVFEKFESYDSHDSTMFGHFPSFSLSDNGETMVYSTFGESSMTKVVGLQGSCEDDEYVFRLSISGEIMRPTVWSFVPIVFSPLFDKFVVDTNAPANFLFSCNSCYRDPYDHVWGWYDMCRDPYDAISVHIPDKEFIIENGCGPYGHRVVVEEFCVPRMFATCSQFFLYTEFTSSPGISGTGFEAYLMGGRDTILVGSAGKMDATCDDNEILFTKVLSDGDGCPVMKDLECNEGMVVFSLLLPLDLDSTSYQKASYTRGVHWNLTLVDEEVPLKSKEYNEGPPGQLVVEQMCLSKQMCYRLVIDKQGGGLFQNDTVTAYLGAEQLFTREFSGGCAARWKKPIVETFGKC